jgi:hypothetical protein
MWTLNLLPSDTELTERASVVLWSSIYARPSAVVLHIYVPQRNLGFQKSPCVKLVKQPHEAEPAN